MPEFRSGVYPAPSLIPAGEYEFIVEKALERLSRNENEMISLKLSVYVPEQKKCSDLWTQLVFVQIAGCIKTIDDFLAATGTKLQRGETFNLSATACEGRVGWVVLDVEDFEGGKRNKVKKFVRRKPEYFVSPGPDSNEDPDAEYYRQHPNETPDDIPS